MKTRMIDPIIVKRVVLFIIAICTMGILHTEEAFATPNPADSFYNPSYVPAPPVASDIDLTNNFTLVSDSNSKIHVSRPYQVVVTPDYAKMKGGLWYNYRIDMTKDFSMTTYFYLGVRNFETGGSDGMAFVMHNDARGLSAIGSQGSGIGYNSDGVEYPGTIDTNQYIHNAMAIEMDSYWNSNSGGLDPGSSNYDAVQMSYAYRNTGHIAVVYPGPYTNPNAATHHHLQFPTLGNTIMDGNWHKIQIDWDASTKLLTYKVGSWAINTVSVEPMDVFGSNLVYWGFTGSTGNSHMNYQSMAIMNYPQEPEADLIKSVRNITQGEMDYETVADSYLNDVVEYKLIIDNDADSPMPIVNGVLKDYIKDGHDYVAGSMKMDGVSVTPTFSGREFSVSLKNEILPGEKVEITFQAKVLKAITNPIENQYTVESQYASDMTSNKTKVYINPELILTKAVDKEHSYVNGVLTYTLELTNHKDAGKWLNGAITDALPTHTQYIANSTKIKRPTDSSYQSISDTSAWDSLKENLAITNLTLEPGETIVVQFQVKILASGLNQVIENQGYHVGENIRETEVSGESNIVKTYVDYVMIHLRQVIIEPHQDLVIPTKGYFTLLNKEQLTDTTYSLRTALITGSTTFDTSATVVSTLFTENILLQVNDTALGYQIITHVPEYYEYVGHIQTTQLATLNVDHLSALLPSNSKDIEPFLDYSNTHEYWVSVYITPKLGKNDEDDPEEDPRPYSWDTITNDFGKIDIQ